MVKSIYIQAPWIIARGKIFGIKSQPVVKSIYIQAPMNYFLTITSKMVLYQSWFFKHKNLSLSIYIYIYVLTLTSRCLMITVFFNIPSWLSPHISPIGWGDQWPPVSYPPGIWLHEVDPSSKMQRLYMSFLFKEGLGLWCLIPLSTIRLYIFENIKII